MANESIDILYLIDRLEELVARSFQVPLSSHVAVHRQRLLDLIDRMRVAMPADIRGAREVLQKQEEVLAQAQEEAARIIARAQTELEERLKSAQQQMEEADLYALQTMRRLEAQINNFLSTIRKGIETMEERGH